jgi:hypothetical protein
MVDSAVLSPSGTTAIASMNGEYEGGGGIAEFSLQPLNPGQMLLHDPNSGADGGDQLLAIDPTGRHLLVDGPSFGRLDGNYFTPLPEPADNQGLASAAAW